MLFEVVIESFILSWPNRANITLCSGMYFSWLFDLLGDHKKLTPLLVRGGNSDDLNAEVPDFGEDLPRGIGGSNQLVQI